MVVKRVQCLFGNEHYRFKDNCTILGSYVVNSKICVILKRFHYIWFETHHLRDLSKPIP